MEQLFNKTQYENNEIVAKVFIGLAAFSLLVWLCCILQIFNFNRMAMNLFLGISMAALLTPAIFIHVFHKNTPVTKYVLIAIITFIVGLYYCIFTFQMLLMFIIPSLIAMLYMDKILLYFSGILTVIMIFTAHVITGFYLLQPWMEPFTKMREIIQYGGIPRIMQYGVCFCILTILMNRVLSYMEQLRVICSERLTDTTQKDRAYSKEWEQYHTCIQMLTEREKEVFAQVIMGKTNAQIADILHLSLGTVKNYVSSIYEKIEIKERSYLILKFGRFAEESNRNYVD